jgi:hypothetical protein
MTPLVTDAALDVLLSSEPEGSLLADLAAEIKRLQLCAAGCAPIPGQVRRAARALARRLARAQSELAALRTAARAARSVLAEAERCYPPDEWPLPQAGVASVDVRPLLRLKEALAGLEG